MSTPQELKFVATNESITVIIAGKMHVAKKGAPNFESLRKALLAGDWKEVPHHLETGSSLERWAKGKFKVADGAILYQGKALPADINTRIVEMATNGEDPTPLMKFWERLQENPSFRSVEQLWRFLNNIGIPLTSDGHFLAYKSVRKDFKDVHSGTIDNHPGQVIRMPRNEISDDPSTPCHKGLHVGALEYAQGFGGSQMVICKVNPRDVVCVPFDASSQKMRVCEYEVIGIHGEGHMPSTTIPDADLPKKQTGKKRSKEFARLDGLDESLLMQESYETLRKYAAQGLQIVGAYNIRGGKWALVQAISKARES